MTSRPQSEHGLPLAAADLDSGTLPAASWIRTNRIVTLNASLVVKTVGRVGTCRRHRGGAVLRIYRISRIQMNLLPHGQHRPAPGGTVQAFQLGMCVVFVHWTASFSALD